MNKLVNVNAYLKAVFGGLVAGLTLLASELADGTLTAQDYLLAAVAFLTGLGVVYVVPNSGGK